MVMIGLDTHTNIIIHVLLALFFLLCTRMDCVTNVQEVVKTLEEKRKARATEWYQQKKRIMVIHPPQIFNSCTH